MKEILRVHTKNIIKKKKLISLNEFSTELCHRLFFLYIGHQHTHA